MQKIKSYVLPIAIVLGLLLHDYCAAFSVVVPYIIFTILSSANFFAPVVD